MNSKSSNPLQYDLNTVCENCELTLADHKGWYCVEGPKHFRTIASTEYKGQLIEKVA